MSKPEPTEKISEDLGLNNSVTQRVVRQINKDGSFNVLKLGIPPLKRINVYKHLLTMPWRKFNVWVLLVYIGVNLIFTCIYALIGFEHLTGLMGNDFATKFWDTFFFSAQTLTTVGYGRINPIGFGTSTVAMLESMVGLLGFALATGLLYGRFSRPNARIIFSEKSIVAPYKNFSGWMFRIANERDNQLIDLEVQVILSRVIRRDGRDIREYLGLELERDKVNFFPTSWTIVHPITHKSPMFDMDEAAFKAGKPEFLIIVKGYDDIFATQVHTRMSYTWEEVFWNEKFTDIHGFSEEGITQVDLSRINETHHKNI